MNLLISENLPADIGLDRTISWTDDLTGYVSLLSTEGEIVDCHDYPTYGGMLAWIEPRLSALRDVFTSRQ